MIPGAAESFGAVAAQYARARPSYPVEALDWLLPASASRVLDLGAGTGQLTNRLIERGLEVTAVEPSEEMRAELSRALPGARVVAGWAEAIPLPDGSVDVVLCAQAWHWVDRAQGVPEVARVLSPGGCLGLLWNIRDERVDWVAQLGRLLATKTDQDMCSENPAVGTPFAPLRRHDVSWVHTLAPQQLLELVASRSYVITLPPGERAELISAVADLIATHPSLVGRDAIDLPYLTRCARTALPIP